MLLPLTGIFIPKMEVGGVIAGVPKVLYIQGLLRGLTLSMLATCHASVLPVE